jgi:hypothetical protein
MVTGTQTTPEALPQGDEGLDALTAATRQGVQGNQAAQRSRMNNALQPQGAGATPDPHGQAISMADHKAELDRMHQDFEGKLQQANERAEQNRETQEDPHAGHTIRSIAYEHVRKPLGVAMKAFPLAVDALSGGALIGGIELLRRAPVVGKHINTVGATIRDTTAKALTLPLGITAPPRAFFNALAGKDRMKFAGPFIKTITLPFRGLGKALRVIWKPGTATGLLDGTIDHVSKWTKGILKGSKDAIVGTANGIADVTHAIGKVLTAPLTVIDGALNTIGLKGGWRIAAGAAAVGATYYTGATWIGSAGGWIMQKIAELGVGAF